MTLYAQDPSGSYVEASDDFIVQAALSIADERMRHGPTLNRRLLKEYLLLRFSKLEHEVFAIIHLDGRNRVIDCEVL